MLKTLIPKNLIQLKVNNESQRGLWWWTVMMFNRMDVQRTKALGYDRTCAEWALKNGACVQLTGFPKLLCDYNVLPPENIKFIVKEIQADNAGINTEGFSHIKGCENLEMIKLTNCSYVEDSTLEKFVLRKDSLKIVEISQCKNITNEGIATLGNLTKLEKLIIKDLPYLKNPEKVKEELKLKLANCDININ